MAETTPEEQVNKQLAADAAADEEAENLKAMQVTALNKLVHRLDSTGIADYVRLMQSTPRVLWLNFLSGIARGLGFTVGTALVLALVYKIISRLITMNIPYLTDMLQDLVEIIKATP